MGVGSILQGSREPTVKPRRGESRAKLPSPHPSLCIWKDGYIVVGFSGFSLEVLEGIVEESGEPEAFSRIF